MKMSGNTRQTDACFSKWIAEYRGIPMKVARAYAPEPQHYGDLFQEMLLQIWRSLASYREEAKPSTWIYRVCLNTALNWRRGVAIQRNRTNWGIEITEMASEAASPSVQVGDRELLNNLYEAIRALPGSDRALVLLTLDGLTYRDIAEVTGLTENHIGVLLTRARKRLAQLMKGVTNELE